VWISTEKGDRLRYALGVRARNSATLLIILVVFLFAGPFLRTEFKAHIAQVAITVLMLGMVYGVSYSRRTLVIGVCLAVPAVVLGWGGSTTGWENVTVAGVVFNLLLIGYVCFLMSKHFWRQHKVTPEMLREAVIVYLLIGTAWAMTYVLIEHFDPAALNGLGSGDAKFSDILYFSFVTLTTLGYGDISPASPGAQSVAVLQALVGQIYLTFIVARLVGLHIASEVTQD
jgi:hypothetical protein